MKDRIASVLALTQIRLTRLTKELQTELVRKSIHLMIAFVPFFAAINRPMTLFVLAIGTLFYTAAEYARINGFQIFLISKITESAQRERDQGKFVLGPVTLAVGAMIALLFYPEPAASIAIFALAFGDGLSSLMGKLLGEIKIPFTGGKSIEGSLTCFIVVFIPTYWLIGNAVLAVIISLVATFLEALPTKDMDNIILPAGTGLFTILLSLVF